MTEKDAEDGVHFAYPATSEFPPDYDAVCRATEEEPVDDGKETLEQILDQDGEGNTSL